MNFEIYRESVSTKAFLLAAASGIGVFLTVTIRLFLWLSAEQARPHPTTGFPPYFAIFFGLAYAIPTCVLIFIAAAIVFGVIDVIRRKRGGSNTRV
jgi:hypothetical protein